MTHPNFDAWRIFRILAEFVEGFETMADIGPSVSFFGSARIGPENPYYQLSVLAAEKVAQKGFAVITGGGPGAMEGANKGAQNVKGKSCGININLPYEPRCNPYIDRKYELNFHYFFVRKVMFVRYAQAFVFLPGGFGTLDELFEALNLIQTKRIRSFPIFLLGKSYWTGLIDWIKNTALDAKHLTDEDLSLIKMTDDVDEIANTIEAHYRARGPAPTFDLGEKNNQSQTGKISGM
jgi:uncharacterized protein (TIGR00730 family)